MRSRDAVRIAAVGTSLVAAALAVFAVYSFVRWPIVAGDTDLWYHLNGGRYIWTNRIIPRDSSFFSFIDPPRPWVDYYWLFQVVVFKLYAFAGYPALIVLRAALYAAAVFMIWRLLLRRAETADDETAGPPFWLLIMFGFYVVLLIPRYLLVRPHLFSYTFLIAVLWILESGGKRLLILPVLGLLWVNLHGGAYPVMTLVMLAYLAEMAVRWWRGTAVPGALWRALVIVAAMNTIYLTPHGLDLLGVPFTPTEAASVYIGEFRRVALAELLTFGISTETFAPTYPSMFNVIMVAAFASIVVSMWQRRLRVSHVLLVVGGAALLAKGTRFRYEFMLLSLPAIAAVPLIPQRLFTTRKSQIAGAVATLGILAMSVSAVSYGFGYRPRYPMSPSRLPVGVVTFLDRIGGGGRLLNDPNSGGYLQWMLSPKYKIFMDMEVPFLFTDEDMATAAAMFGNRQVLDRVLTSYQPDFVTVRIDNGRFKRVIEGFPHYVLVFFDDQEVLYVDARKHPEIAREFEIPRLDPYALPGTDGAMLVRDRATLSPVLRRISSIHPDGSLANQVLGVIETQEGALGEAVSRADLLIRTYPEAPAGYALKGQALKARKSFRDAIRWYREAERRADAPEQRQIRRELGLLYKELGQYRVAYELLRDSMDVFHQTTSYREMFDVGEVALKAGRTAEASLIFRLGAARVPPDDREWQEKYQHSRAQLSAGGPPR